MAAVQLNSTPIINNNLLAYLFILHVRIFAIIERFCHLLSSTNGRDAILSRVDYLEVALYKTAVIILRPCSGAWYVRACVVTVVANVSVLSWWFRDQSSSLVISDSLQAELSLSKDDRTWTISISGQYNMSPEHVSGWLHKYM